MLFGGGGEGVKETDLSKVTADKRLFNSVPMATVQHYIRDIKADTVQRTGS